jgi:hypothetical protein
MWWCMTAIATSPPPATPAWCRFPQCWMLPWPQPVTTSFTPIPWNPGRAGKKMPTMPSRKRQRAEPLYRALEKIIPDLRQRQGDPSRIVLESDRHSPHPSTVFTAAPGHLWPRHQSRGGTVPRWQNPGAGALSGGRLYPAGDWGASGGRLGDIVRQRVGVPGAEFGAAGRGIRRRTGLSPWGDVH